MCGMSWNLRASTCWNAQALSRPVMGLLFVVFCHSGCALTFCYEFCTVIMLFWFHYLIFYMNYLLSHSLCVSVFEVHSSLVTWYFFQVFFDVPSALCVHNCPAPWPMLKVATFTATSAIYCYTVQWCMIVGTVKNVWCVWRQFSGRMPNKKVTACYKYL